MIKKAKLDLSSFEVLAENDKGALVGGFSTTLSNPHSAELGSGINGNNCGNTNNCSGGNCVSGCGS